MTFGTACAIMGLYKDEKTEVERSAHNGNDIFALGARFGRRLCGPQRAALGENNLTTTAGDASGVIG